LEAIQSRRLGPIFLVGFSLGGNVVLKLAGELAENRLLAAVCGISVPLDLAECARALARPANGLYARRFLSRLKARVVRKALSSPQYSVAGLSSVRSIWEFDDRFTGPLFGFGTAENYYRTQSSAVFLESIRIPTLVIQAIDDPMIPFSVYDRPVFLSNPCLELLAVPRGGHLGFISKRPPRFWLDEVVLHWLGLQS
jgi:predicted alpha/beta-fold hydrolase